ncbi:MAG TPA: hypothetical protein VE978_05515 [Chitinophagales bacterium]|nr:hypothetical protein [Chitinophagales bacterium]
MLGLNLKIVCFGVLFSGFLLHSSPVVLQETINVKQNIKPTDTSYYHVYIGIESGVTEEFIETYYANGKVYGDVTLRQYLKFENVNEPPLIQKLHSFKRKSIKLSKSQIDTLINFSRMLKDKNIIHNQGIKIAGRIGIYQTVINGDTTSFESKELYSLLDAIGYRKAKPPRLR